MRYLPILGELLASDSLIFMIIGLVVAAIIGIAMKSTKKNIVALCVSFAVYVIAEVISNIRSNYFIELVLLFVGTLAIGGILGFLLGFIVSKARK